MPRPHKLKAAAAWVEEVAHFCDAVRPSLLRITEFLLFVLGLVTVVMLVFRAH